MVTEKSGVADQSVAEFDAGYRPSKRPEVVVINRWPPGEVARAVLVVISLGITFYLLYRVQEVLFLLVLAILLATAIEPLVNRLRRGPFTRGSGVLVVYTLIILAIAIPIYAVAPSLVSQAASFSDALPERLQSLRPYAVNLQPRPFQALALSALDDAL